MIWPEAEAIILQTFDTAWDDKTPIAWPNGSTEELPDNDVFVAITPCYVYGDASLGVKKLYRHHGIVMFDIYVPKNSGSGAASDCMKDISDIFRDKTISDITYTRPGFKLHTTQNRISNFISIEKFVSYSFEIPFFFEENTII